jgi:hypothetical protein
MGAYNGIIGNVAFSAGPSTTDVSRWSVESATQVQNKTSLSPASGHQVLGSSCVKHGMAEWERPIEVKTLTIVASGDLYSTQKCTGWMVRSQCPVAPATGLGSNYAAWRPGIVSTAGVLTYALDTGTALPAIGATGTIVVQADTSVTISIPYMIVDAVRGPDANGQEGRFSGIISIVATSAPTWTSLEKAGVSGLAAFVSELETITGTIVVTDAIVSVNAITQKGFALCRGPFTGAF